MNEPFRVAVAPSGAACPACEGVDVARSRPYRASSEMLRNRELWACDGCGFHFVHPMPSDEALREYNAAYFDSAHGGLAEAEAAGPFHRAVNLLRFRHVSAALSERARETGRPLEVLEIGPGLGDFAQHLMAAFPDAAYTVVESDRECRSLLDGRGVRVFETIEDVSDSTGFDLLVMSHVLEHVAGPAVFLESLTHLLAAGAIVFIEVPCRDHEHKQQDEPHLSFFDKAPMEQLVTRVGLSDPDITYHGLPLSTLSAPSALAVRSRRLWRRVGARAVAAGLWFGPETLRLIDDREGRAGAWFYQAHRQHSAPSWWLRCVARVPETKALELEGR